MTQQMTIGEIAGQVGLRPSTLRYYEKLGLLPPAERISGQRRYRPEIKQRLEMINAAKEMGFSLNEVKLLLDGLSTDSPPSERWLSVAQAKLPEVEKLIQRAQMMKRILEKGLNCECVTIEDCFEQMAAASAVKHRLTSWREMNQDTSPEAEAILFKLWREAPAWRKLGMMEDLNRAARQLALAGLRQRFPDASPGKLHRRLAAMLLGEGLAARVYGPLPGQRRDELVDSQALQVTLRVTNALAELGIPYVIGGSMASIIHGMLRTTLDVDIVADIRSEQIVQLVTRLGDGFYADEQMIRQAVQQRGSFNLIHLPTTFKVDIFIPKGRPFDQQQLDRRILETVDTVTGEHIWVLSVEDVILAKMDWFRLGGEVSQRQWRDILGVLKTQLSTLDIDYLNEWAQKLNVADLMKRALEEMTGSR